MSYQDIIERAFLYTLTIDDTGKLPTYIPELENIDPNKFGVHIATKRGIQVGLGDYNENFSIQSVSKVLTLCLAYKTVGEAIWDRVGVEPSGTPFNSLIQLESDHGIPRNPFINAGALVICDILLNNFDNPKEDLLVFIRSLSGDTSINFNPIVAASEKACGYRNVALCNFIKSLGNLDNEPEDVLDFYYNLCSLESSCKGLSRLFFFLANRGRTIHDDTQILTRPQTKRINAIMQTCGFYDESGEFAFEVGLPGKSGVGGGIVAIHPDKYAIVTWSPKLNKKGNSFRGMKFLEEFTTLTEQSIF